MKELLGKEIAKRITDGLVIGVGTGSTVDVAVEAIGKRIKAEGLQVKCVVSSNESAKRATQNGLTVLSPFYSGEIAWGFDGADEVDPKLRLIKGAGAAMLQEKILARRCGKFFVIVTEEKLVKKLGEKFPIPVEVIPEATSYVVEQLKAIGATECVLREGSGKYGAVITEKGNYILDVRFKEIPDSLEHDIKQIVGVVESGLFFNTATEVLVGSVNGVSILTKRA